MPNLDPYDALKVHKSKVVIPCNQDISIARQSGIVLRDLFKKLKRGVLDTRKVPDITFVGEEGIDAAGLTKEFFTLIMSALASGKGGYILFEGKLITWFPLTVKNFIKVAFSSMLASLLACQYSTVMLVL